MSELTFHGLDIGRVDPGDDLIDLIVEEAASSYPLEDGDVVAMTSKIVSIDEGRMVDAEEVEVTDRDERVADITRMEKGCQTLAD